MNDCGRLVSDRWSWLESQYPYVHLDECKVMPNHLHGIIVIAGDRPHGTGTGSAERKPLGRLIGAFKTVSTKHVNGFRSTPGVRLWQRNYYEHIVRDDLALRRIRAYIATNPARWKRDRQNRVHARLSALP